ncbi:2-succinyl-5-enolpyruvyl-6-hydroxy-3-cyclohexene-1-carboxylate synthase [Mangrovimonas aestuarii]|uniref:2-succinyl-5-enolpyruvyl-6-hydroxy-3- cyclohexene-1-carboxylate synthase n=1 Tax=Mangrovimonas aestuarii TaxID=3018443 RepID=UPI0023794F89|nr:2-succinyl-5-enolpyruvyl-6-hydroxy-3-cyclohexene-1-carboxylate synthase [Mangrovimonas aestuarii]
MKYPNIPLAQTVVQLCKLKGIRHIVISPGSRNAPLTIGFTTNEAFKCYSIVDERCAAFFALGIAQQLQEPVAVVCTSGSALLNYYPAISEAYYSNIPLVVLSADRPEYLVGIGDGQTINQKDVYANHILYSANLKQDIRKKDALMQTNVPIMASIDNTQQKVLELQTSIQKYNEQEINKAINTAVENLGPVHINIPFDEPLYERVEDLIVEPEVIPAKSSPLDIDEITVESCVLDWNKAKRKMILVGVNSPNSIDGKWLEMIAQDDSVVVFTEKTSNINHPKSFSSIDKIITPLDESGFENLQPDLLITMGGLIVSKKIKAFLRKYKPQQHWHIGEQRANDTFFCLNRHLEVSPNVFFSNVLPQIEVKDSDYRANWQSVKESRAEKHKLYMEQIPFSDFKAFNVLLESIPGNSLLQLGNSSTIRYAQLFDLNPTLKVFCNRGTSGIDGSTSTAVGCAVVGNEQTVFISGDLSFLYDSNALWNNYIPKDFRIIVINNQGGGIFRILPGHKNTDNFDGYFETIHNLTAEYLCSMYGFDYSTAKNEDELKNELINFYSESTSPRLLEVFTPRKINDEVLLDYFKFIK